MVEQRGGLNRKRQKRVIQTSELEEWVVMMSRELAFGRWWKQRTNGVDLIHGIRGFWESGLHQVLEVRN